MTEKLMPGSTDDDSDEEGEDDCDYDDDSDRGGEKGGPECQAQEVGHLQEEEGQV